MEYWTGYQADFEDDSERGEKRWSNVEIELFIVKAPRRGAFNNSGKKRFQSDKIICLSSSRRSAETIKASMA